MDEIRRSFSDETDDAGSMFENEPQPTSSGDIFHYRAVNIARVGRAVAVCNFCQCCHGPGSLSLSEGAGSV